MIKNRFTLKQLEAFTFVVDTGSFRAAAAVLGTTQPNISARISTLEEVLGTVLLHRNAGSVRLTQKGQALLMQARNILRASEEFLEVAGRQDLLEERLRLGVSELIACTWLQEFLRALKQAYPAVRVELQVELSHIIEAEFAAKQVDLAIHTGPFKTKTQGHVSVGEYPYIWVANPELLSQIGSCPDLQTIFDFPILCHAKQTVAAKGLNEAAKSAGLPLDQIVHSSSLTACVPMAVDGMGIALLPERILRDELQAGRLQKLACDWLPPPLSFGARYDPPRAAGFVQKAAKLAAQIAAQFP